MDLGLKGRKAIVCASSKGLGYACALELARNGVHVYINGRHQDVLKEAAASIQKETGGKATPVVADVTTSEGRQQLLAACPEPDILVNNNGGPPFREFSDLTEDDIKKGLAMNMIAPVAMVQGVLDGMISRKFGRIVNITSVSVRMPIYGLDLSSGARAGLTALLAGVARKVARHNVTINNLLPGMFETERLDALYQNMAEKEGVSVDKIREKQTAPIAAARHGNPTEFGKTCAFLCADSSGYIVGQNILIDGGWSTSTF